MTAGRPLGRARACGNRQSGQDQGQPGRGQSRDGQGAATGNVNFTDLLLSYQSELNLSEEQVEQLRELRDEVSRNTGELRNKLSAATRQYNSLVGQPVLELGALEDRVREAEELRTDLITEQLRSFVEARETLEDQQRNQLRQVLAREFGQPSRRGSGMTTGSQGAAGQQGRDQQNQADRDRWARTQRELIQQNQDDWRREQQEQASRDSTAQEQWSRGRQDQTSQGRTRREQLGEGVTGSDLIGRQIMERFGMFSDDLLWGGLPAVNLYLSYRDQLGLEQVQVEQLNELRRERLDRLAQLRGELFTARQQLWIDLTQEDITMDEVRDRLLELGDLRAEIRVATLQGYADAGEVLNEDQRQTALQLFEGEQLSPGRLEEEGAERSSERGPIRIGPGPEIEAPAGVARDGIGQPVRPRVRRLCFISFAPRSAGPVSRKRSRPARNHEVLIHFISIIIN